MREPASTSSDSTTMTDVVDDYRRAGFTEEFTPHDDGTVSCGACDVASPVERIEVRSLTRLEGASDPADMAAVLGLSCPACGRRGVAVVKYGPDADAAEADLLLKAQDVRFTSSDTPPASSAEKSSPS